MLCRGDGWPCAAYRTRMRRAATAVLVLLAVLAVVGVVVDRVAVARTEARLLAEAQEQLELADGTEVVIDGFPFLTQVAAGRLAEVRGTAPTAVVDGLELHDVRVAARGVTPEEPYTAEAVEINAGVPVESLRDAVGEVAGMPGDLLDLELLDGRLQLGLDVAGLDLQVLLEPTLADGAITLEVGAVEVAGASVPDEVRSLLDELLGDVPLNVPGLPEGLEPTRLSVEEDGLQVRLEGADVELGSWVG